MSTINSTEGLAYCESVSDAGLLKRGGGGNFHFYVSFNKERP